MLTAADDALGAASRRLHLWWVVGYTLLVACASLYPFGFDGERLLFAATDGFSRFLDWRDPTRRDTILNLLAYLPVGIGAALALPARLPAAARLALATATGAALSLAIELLQFASPVRVPSIADWTLNVAATAAGATASLAVARLPGLSMSRRLRRLRVNPSLALLILVWIASHAAPFLPRRPRAIRGALDAFLALDVTLGGLAASMAAFLVLSAVLRTLLNRDSFWAAFGALVGLSFAARLLFVGQQLTLDEPLALALTLPIIARLRDRGYASAQTPLFAFICVAWLVHGLAPFAFAAPAQPVSWLPFPEFAGGATDGGYVDVLRRAFVCIGAVWVAAGSSLGLGAGTAMLLGVVAVGELAQRYLPTRVPDTTDAVLVLFGALLVHAANRVDEAPRPG
jgi:VanZ family protein